MRERAQADWSSDSAVHHPLSAPLSLFRSFPSASLPCMYAPLYVGQAQDPAWPTQANRQHITEQHSSTTHTRKKKASVQRTTATATNRLRLASPCSPRSISHPGTATLFHPRRPPAPFDTPLHLFFFPLSFIFSSQASSGWADPPPPPFSSTHSPSLPTRGVCPPTRLFFLLADRRCCCCCCGLLSSPLWPCVVSSLPHLLTNQRRTGFWPKGAAPNCGALGWMAGAGDRRRKTSFQSRPTSLFVPPCHEVLYENRVMVLRRDEHRRKMKEKQDNSSSSNNFIIIIKQPPAPYKPPTIV